MVTPIENRVTLSVRVSNDDRFPAPMIWSPSQWPSSARSLTFAERRSMLGNAGRALAWRA